MPVGLLYKELELPSTDNCLGRGGTAGGLLFPVAVILGTGGAGGCGGGPRFVRKLTSVATGTVEATLDNDCFFCFLSVKVFCSSALKSNVGPLLLLLFKCPSVRSLGGDRFGVVLLAEILFSKQFVVVIEHKSVYFKFQES